MLSLFKLKKKSKKAKDQSQDDEKENTSSPTKVKKVEKTPSSAKESGKKKSKVLNENKKQDETENNKNSKKSATLPAASTSSPNKVNGKSGNTEKLNTLGLDSPYQNGSSSTKPLVVDVTTTPILASAPKSPKQHLTPKAEAVASEPSPISASGTSSGSDGVNGTPVTPANNANVARVPVLSASDAANTSSFVRGNFLSSTISGSDLNRYLNSGYMHSGDSYLQKPVDPKYAKSPHFHRPPNFSFYRNAGPNYVITPRRNANRGAIRTLIMSSSSMSSNARSSRVGQTMPSNSNAKRVRSNSPVASKRDDEQAVTTTAVKSEQSTVEPSAQQAGEEPVTKINIDNEEPIRLSKFSGGYEPDPQTPRKIESLDWPAPPYPAAVPELRARSRSSSNRYGHSTVYSVDGAEQCLDDSDQDEDEEDVNLEVTATTTTGQLNQSAVTNSSVATSTKRPKSRPTPKYQYRHGFFDNDYDDYLLQYKPRSEWRKHLERHKQISGLATTAEDVNNNKPTTATAAAEVEVVEEDVEPAEKLAQEKLKKEIDEIAKLENESSMAADLIKEIKAEQKMAHRKLKIDPWKASRTPSAKAEPSVRTRFDSPVNASPSRVFYYNIAGSHRIPNTPSGHTISTTTPGTAGFLHSSTTASTSFFSGTGGGGGVQSAGSNSSTLIASGSGGVGGVAVTSSSSNNAITNAQSINYNLDSSATSSAALMASPSSPPPKSATLPVTASSTSSSAQQHYSAYSSSSAASSSHRANTLSQASTSPTITANGTPKAGMANIVYNIAVPKPGYGLSSPNKSVTLPNSVRYAGMPTHRSVDFERRAMSPIYDSTLHSPPSPRTHYERVRLEQELKLYAVIEQFAQLTKSTPNLIENPKIYPYEVLSTGPRKKLPAEVDRQNLERHLSDDEFRQLFGMSLKDFYQLPYWKRVDMKKVAKLF